MKKTDIEVIPYKERKEFILKSCLMYGKMLTQRENMKKLKNDINLKNIDTISLFENVLELLTKDECLIINKDFIKESQYSEWYLDHWSKTTYYKYKHQAINKMIYLLFS